MTARMTKTRIMVISGTSEVACSLIIVENAGCVNVDGNIVNCCRCLWCWTFGYDILVVVFVKRMEMNDSGKINFFPICR